MPLELSPVLRSRYLVFFATVSGWWYCSVAQLRLILCDPNGLHLSAFPVTQQLLEFAQIHVHWVSDSAQPSHPPLPPSPLALNLAQYQGLFQWVRSLHQVAKGLEVILHHQSFQWIFRVDFLYDWVVWSPCCPRDFQESAPTPQFEVSILQHSVFFMVQLSHLYMTTGKTTALIRLPLSAKWCLCFLIHHLGLSLLFFQGVSIF